jgi:hypothetical protein
MENIERYRLERKVRISNILNNIAGLRDVDIKNEMETKPLSNVIPLIRQKLNNESIPSMLLNSLDDVERYKKLHDISTKQYQELKNMKLELLDKNNLIDELVEKVEMYHSWIESIENEFNRTEIKVEQLPIIKVSDEHSTLDEKTINTKLNNTKLNILPMTNNVMMTHNQIGIPDIFM